MSASGGAAEKEVLMHLGVNFQGTRSARTTRMKRTLMEMIEIRMPRSTPSSVTVANRLVFARLKSVLGTLILGLRSLLEVNTKELAK
jgi:hypothetical protein